MDRSSSNDLSSAPSSDNEAPHNNHALSTNLHALPTALSTSLTSLPPNAASTKNLQGSAAASATRQDGAPVKKPAKPRKKKEVDPNAPPAPKKEKKPRKPRESKDGTTARATKKVKTENDPPNSIISQQSSIATNLNQSHLVQPLQPIPIFSDSRPSSSHEAAKISQNGFSMHGSANSSRPQSPTQARYQTTPQAQPVQPVVQQRSRMAFDPVRGIERSSEQPQTITYPSLNETPPRATPAFRPSASPAINSILNHEISSSSLPTLSKPVELQPSVHIITSNGTSTDPMVIDEAEPRVGSNDLVVKKAPSADKSDTEGEGKRKRAKEQPPPAPIGSGLLNSTFFGGDATSDGQGKVGKGVNIVLQIDLKKDENKIFNFARMAEEKYGFAAVYPRQAAQKERLAKVAAVGAALERSASGSKRGEISVAESGDEDLSVDIDRDSDNDGDINMTGVNGTNENSGVDGPAPRQRRKKKDEYDMDDPFVDDSEALWEAQAAASRDGFFVYMGSLVTEEKPKEDKAADSTSKRGGRGRGRGGGPGSRGGRAAAATSAADGTTKAPSKRGGGVSRKPRITKAERQQRELEKEQREQAGSALATKTSAPPQAAA